MTIKGRRRYATRALGNLPWTKVHGYKQGSLRDEKNRERIP